MKERLAASQHRRLDREELSRLAAQQPGDDSRVASDLRQILDPHQHELRQRQVEGEPAFGPGIACDAILWRPDDGTDPLPTRIGGRPYWPRGLAWPLSAEAGEVAEPLVFLGQLCFRDSRDVLGDPELPGDYLLLFSDPAGVENGRVHPRDDLHLLCTWVEWIPKMPVLPLEEIPAGASPLSPLVGDLYRTMDFPFAEREAIAGSTRFLECMVTHKIGGVPVTAAEPVELPPGARHLATVCSVPELPGLRDRAPLTIGGESGRAADGSLTLLEMGGDSLELHWCL